MNRSITLFFTLLISSFFVSQHAFAYEQNFQNISQKLEKSSQGLVGRIGIAAQERGSP